MIPKREAWESARGALYYTEIRSSMDEIWNHVRPKGSLEEKPEISRFVS